MMGIKQRVMKRLAASHIAGPTIEDALEICRQVEKNGWSMTICPWTDSSTTADDALKKYRKAISAITQYQLDCQLSVKTPALHYDRDKVQILVEEAKRGNVFLQFDAHGPETADPTFRLVEEARKVHDRVGCTLPSRWQRSVDDARRVRSLGIGVRLVKGQWADPDASRMDARKNFLKIADQFLGSSTRVSVATHDSRLAHDVLKNLRDAKSVCELELLFSLPLGILRVARSLNVPVRIYTPYGHPYLPYNITHIRTRPVIAMWAVKNFIIGKSHPHLGAHS